MSSVAEILDSLLEQGPQGMARFAASLDPTWIDEALAATGSASIRRRKLPAEQTLWLVLGMGLFADRSIVEVVEHLSLVMPGVKSLAKSAIPAARYRLGAEPLEWLFHRVADEWAHTPGLGDYKGLALYGVDGSSVRVQDSDANLEHFTKPGGRAGPGDAGYPQVRAACLLNLRNRMVLDARFGPFSVSESSLAEQLWSRVPDDSLTILDRGFVDYGTFTGLVSQGCNRHLMVRMRSDMKYELVRVLDDGSALARLRPSRNIRTARPELPAELLGRVIEYQHPGGKPSRLFVTLVDDARYPAPELVALYHERWEIEIAYDEIKTHMLERRECLRSKRPEGVYQELWGLMLAYNLVRREMLLAAQAHGLEPTRISFRSSLLWIRGFWLTSWTGPPGNIPRHLGELRSTLDVLILPLRRTERRYPRHVKIKMSNYTRNRGKRGQAPTPAS